MTLLVTFKVPGADKHTFGPYKMEAVPLQKSYVKFATVSHGNLRYKISDSPEYFFRNPHHPPEVTIWMEGPYGKSRNLDPYEVLESPPD